MAVDVRHRSPDDVIPGRRCRGFYGDDAHKNDQPPPRMEPQHPESKLLWPVHQQLATISHHYMLSTFGTFDEVVAAITCDSTCVQPDEDTPGQPGDSAFCPHGRARKQVM